MSSYTYHAISIIAIVSLFISITPVQNVKSQVQVTNGGTGISIYTYQNGVYVWLLPESFSPTDFVEGLNSGYVDGQNSVGWNYFSPIGYSFIPLDIYQNRSFSQSYAAGYYQGFIEGYLVPDLGDAGTASIISEWEFYCQDVGLPLAQESKCKKELSELSESTKTVLETGLLGTE